MSELDSWALSEFDDGTHKFPVYRKGEGPGVIVVHEIPGLTDKVLAFGQEVVDAGFTVLMPSLFGTPGRPKTGLYTLASIGRLCVRSEFTKIALRRTSPVADWLRALARTTHDELGGPGVGALGMCFTGGFALAMLADAPVVAPVLAQPSVPFPFGRARGAALDLSAADLTAVKAKTAAGCPVLGLRFTGDPVVGTRFDTLRQELGDKFIAVEFPGKQHSTLTEHRQQEGVERVLAFFRERLTT
ncbi:dienelactone hydrolase family protein [Actinocrispum sp. NPDC049592]|uniref:dienelactone hydrolase family protein n=1 Tax=Actinocrispum sp. NPDC049592 TaxID=3154835 RepID=UPI003432BE9D